MTRVVTIQGSFFKIFTARNDRPCINTRIVHTFSIMRHARLKQVLAAPLKIIVIDDNLHLRSSLELLLHGLGHHVQTAASGEQGIQILRQRPVNLVICDLDLQGLLDGYGAARLLLSTPSCFNTSSALLFSVTKRTARCQPPQALTATWANRSPCRILNCSSRKSVNIVFAACVMHRSVVCLIDFANRYPFSPCNTHSLSC